MGSMPRTSPMGAASDGASTRSRTSAGTLATITSQRRTAQATTAIGCIVLVAGPRSTLLMSPAQTFAPSTTLALLMVEIPRCRSPILQGLFQTPLRTPSSCQLTSLLASTSWDGDGTVITLRRCGRLAPTSPSSTLTLCEQDHLCVCVCVCVRNRVAGGTWARLELSFEGP